MLLQYAGIMSYRTGGYETQNKAAELVEHLSRSLVFFWVVI